MGDNPTIGLIPCPDKNDAVVKYTLGTRQKKIVLVELRDAMDAETGERYTVKRYESVKAREGDSWQHETITLKPLNADFQSIVLTGEDDVRVIAEWVVVLGRS